MVELMSESAPNALKEELKEEGNSDEMYSNKSTLANDLSSVFVALTKNCYDSETT